MASLYLRSDVVKKFTVLFFTTSLILMVVILSGCATRKNNEIGLADLTSAQQDIINLLTTDLHEVFIFNYQLDNTFDTVDFWIEVYAYGELVESLAALSFGHGSARSPLNGQLSVTISYDAHKNFRWAFVVEEDGFRGTSITDFTFNTENVGNMPRSHGPTPESVSIQAGRDIILHTTKFHSGNIVNFDDSRGSQDYIDQPELLIEYPYVIFIKARFSNPIQ